MNKFKSQDRVRIIGNSYYDAPNTLIGALAKVVATTGNSISVLPDASECWYLFDEKDLELIPTSTLDIDRELERVTDADMQLILEASQVQGTSAFVLGCARYLLKKGSLTDRQREALQNLIDLDSIF